MYDVFAIWFMGTFKRERFNLESHFKVGWLENIESFFRIHKRVCFFLFFARFFYLWFKFFFLQVFELVQSVWRDRNCRILAFFWCTIYTNITHTRNIFCTFLMHFQHMIHWRCKEWAFIAAKLTFSKKQSAKINKNPLLYARSNILKAFRNLRTNWRCFLFYVSVWWRELETFSLQNYNKNTYQMVNRLEKKNTIRKRQLLKKLSKIYHRTHKFGIKCINSQKRKRTSNEQTRAIRCIPIDSFYWAFARLHL